MSQAAAIHRPATLQPEAVGKTPTEIAREIIGANSSARGRNFPEIVRQLDALASKDPALAAAVEKEVASQLGPLNYGKLLAATYTVTSADGSILSFSRQAPTVQDYFSGKQGAVGSAHYARLDRLFGDGNANTFDGEKIQAGINELLKSGMSLQQYEALVGARTGEGQASLATTVADLTQMTLDIVGIFDQTGISDGANALISLGRGDWVGAGLSALAIIPVVGALANAGKLGKWAKTISNAIELAASNPAARKALEPLLSKLSAALNAIPDSAMKVLPDSFRETLQGIKTKLDDFLKAGGRIFSDAVVRTAERLGIPPEKVQAVLDAGKGNRADPSTYMTREQINAHLAKFDDGAIRFTSKESVAKRATLGPPGGFIMPASEFSDLMKSAKGDLAIVEKRLGLDPGTLSSDDTLIAYIEPQHLEGLRVPSGNEGGVHETLWLPGGYTSGGVPEAVMDFAKGLPYKEIAL